QRDFAEDQREPLGAILQDLLALNPPRDHPLDVTETGDVPHATHLPDVVRGLEQAWDKVFAPFANRGRRPLHLAIAVLMLAEARPVEPAPERDLDAVLGQLVEDVLADLGGHSKGVEVAG